jgi:hypothetical protein
VAPMGKARSTVVPLAIAVVLAGACLCGFQRVRAAFRPQAGEVYAESLAAEHAERLGRELGYRNRVRDAESIAATEVNTLTSGRTAHSLETAGPRTRRTGSPRCCVRPPRRPSPARSVRRSRRRTS